MEKQEILRLPIIYVLSALGAVVGAFMVYLYMPLDDKVHKAEVERAEMRKDISYLKERLK